MPVYLVIRKSDGVRVHAYTADEPVDFPQLPFADFYHVEDLPPPVPEDAERNISGVSYLRRFTQAERIAIRSAAAQSPILDDYLRLLDTTIAQGGLVNLNDPDTIAALNMLEGAGLLAPGRAAEILA